MHSRCREDWEFDHSFGQTGRKPYERRVLVVVGLTLSVMVIEITAGLLSGSMALLADGVHMGTHAVALGLAAAAFFFARRHAGDRRFSYGTGKAGELAGFASAQLLGVSAILVAAEAIERFFVPQPIAFGEALAVAVLGLVINIASAAVLSSGRHHEHAHEHGHSHHHADSNLRAAILHVVADAVTSLAAIAALVAAWSAGWTWLDPLVAIVAAGVILVWAYGLARDTGRVLLDVEAPEDLRRSIIAAIENDGDSRVVDLHLWSIGPGVLTLVASVVTHREREPNDYKSRLPRHLAVHHPIIEVQRCRGEVA